MSDIYPATHFPDTPRWFQAAVADAIARTGLADWKWTVPLECIGRYESNYNCGAGLANEVDAPGAPIGVMQQGRNFYQDAWTTYPDLFPDKYVGDPVVSVLMAILHINSKLNVSGGYDGIGTIYSTSGLVPRTDRGPGNVLRAWLKDPAAFTVEGARSLYQGY